MPLKKLDEGWYLVWWRVISADGHPVRGAFTFAVGPNPGPAPQFVIPSISETAATPRLLVARWLAFLSVMAAIGLFVLQDGGRPSARSACVGHAAARGVDRVRRRGRDRARRDACLRVPRDGAVRAALGVERRRARAAAARVVVRPRLRRPRAHVRALRARGARRALGRPAGARRTARSRSCSPSAGRCSPRARCCSCPGSSGHAAQTSPRAWSILFDWSHLSAGSIWVGGLIGLLVLWSSLPAAQRIAGLVVSRAALLQRRVRVGERADRRRASPRRSSTCRRSRRSGRRRTERRSSGRSGCSLVAMLIAAVNLLWTRPRLQASAGDRPDVGPATATLLRRLVGTEVVLVAAIVFAAAVLSSLPPPAKALGNLGGTPVRVGPGPVSKTVRAERLRREGDVTPNRAAQPNTFTLSITQGRQAGHRRERHDDVRDARHGDGTAGLRVQGGRGRACTGTPRRRS